MMVAAGGSTDEARGHPIMWPALTGGGMGEQLKLFNGIPWNNVTVWSSYVRMVSRREVSFP